MGRGRRIYVVSMGRAGMSAPSGTSWAIDQGRRLKLSVGERILLVAIASGPTARGIAGLGRRRWRPTRG